MSFFDSFRAKTTASAQVQPEFEARQNLATGTEDAQSRPLELSTSAVAAVSVDATTNVISMAKVVAHRPALSVPVPDDAVEVLNAIPHLAQDIAILLVKSGETAGYLLALDTQIQAAKIHALRQALSATYKPLHLIAISATELSQRRNTSTGQGRQLANANNTQKSVPLNISRGYALIQEAIRRKASDIHIDVISSGRDAGMVAIRYRVHGSLSAAIIERSATAVRLMEETIRGLYQNDDISPAATRVGGQTLTIPVSKRYEAMLKPPIQNAEVRFECMPEKAGFFVVMRLNGYDGKTSARKNLKEIGMSDEQEIDLQRAADSPNGLILVVGPTGSGKTTTVTTALAIDPNAMFKRRLSLEIPPESDVPWLSQIPTSEETLPDDAKGVVRSDPDVISAGEIRDPLTAKMAQDYALTGHITWGTFHANGVFPAFERMLGDHIRFERSILTMSGFLRAAFFQCLIGVLCPDCKKPAKSNMQGSKLALLASKFELNTDGLYVRYKHKGDSPACKRCDGLGVIERTAAIELVVPTRSMLKHIRNNRLDEAEVEYRLQRTAKFDEPGTKGKTYSEHALYKVSQGIACANEIFDVENLWTYEVFPIQTQTQKTA